MVAILDRDSWTPDSVQADYRSPGAQPSMTHEPIVFPGDIKLPSILPHQEAFDFLRETIIDGIGSKVATLALDGPPKVVNWLLDDSRPWWLL